VSANLCVLQSLSVDEGVSVCVHLSIGSDEGDGSRDLWLTEGERGAQLGSGVSESFSQQQQVCLAHFLSTLSRLSLTWVFLFPLKRSGRGLFATCGHQQ